MSSEPLGTVAEVRAYLDAGRRSAGPVALVPTMGALHEGHGSLIDQARSECATVLVSIFVNALQFGPDEDLERYPRRLDDDRTFCALRGVDAVFAPAHEQMYPQEPHTFVEVGPEADGLCGASRPGHFRGVATAVLKLFNIVGPDRAYFGEKDFQQLAVIRRMAEDLNLGIEIVGTPTVREPDGLAISTRNEYLSAADRQIATVLYRALRIARQRIADGDPDPSVAIDAARTVLELEASVRIEYLEIVDPVSMKAVRKIAGPARVAAAIWIGKTRLIDNILCEPPKKKRRRKT